MMRMPRFSRRSAGSASSRIGGRSSIEEGPGVRQPRGFRCFWGRRVCTGLCSLLCVRYRRSQDRRCDAFCRGTTTAPASSAPPACVSPARSVRKLLRRCVSRGCRSALSQQQPATTTARFPENSTKDVLQMQHVSRLPVRTVKRTPRNPARSSTRTPTPTTCPAIWWDPAKFLR